MAATIRLKRVGTRNLPIYRVVVAPSRGKRDGRFIEEIGTYAPRQAADNFKVKPDRIQYWLGVGAQPTNTVRTLLKRAQKAAAKA